MKNHIHDAVAVYGDFAFIARRSKHLPFVDECIGVCKSFNRIQLWIPSLWFNKFHCELALPLIHYVLWDYDVRGESTNTWKRCSLVDRWCRFEWKLFCSSTQFNVLIKWICGTRWLFEKVQKVPAKHAMECRSFLAFRARNVPHEKLLDWKQGKKKFDIFGRFHVSLLVCEWV